MKDKFSQRIRRVLIKHGVIEEAKADQALEAAKKEGDGVTYTDVLLERGFIDEYRYLGAIAQETQMAPVDLAKVSCNEDALGVINQELATYYCVLPISKIGDILTVAIGNPFDILKLDDVRTVTNCELRPVLSIEKAIRTTIHRAYNPDEAQMDKIIDSMDGSDKAVEVKKQEEDDEQIDLSELDDESGESPVIKLVNMIVARGLREKASDIHIEPFEKKIIVRYRKDGILQEGPSPPKSMSSSIVSRIKIISNLDIAERRIPQDGKFQVRFEGRQVDFRVSVLPTIFGEKAVLRILDSSSLNLGIAQLGFEKSAEKHWREALEASYGMILVTGPTGSGKSTTLYASLRELLDPEENVVTVEDPVEYQLHSVIQVPVNVKRGLTFGAALRSILRQDPDIIMIGEIRDFETADIAVKAAITGHLVLSTLHTNDAPSSIMRLVDMGIDRFMVASSVICVAAQRLCRKLCDRCKALDEKLPPKEDLLKMGFVQKDFAKMKIHHPVGCSGCTNGYRGRFAILEALPLDENIRRMVIDGKSAIDVKKYAVKDAKMVTLRRAALLNVMRGRTSLEEALRLTMGDDV
ncbi:MAG: GspE/PulE family protein [Planctomycetota bacterium]|jgi:type IV pilus assembly protein PilB